MRTKIAKICPVCSKEYSVFPYLIKQGYGKHCSSKCYGETKKGMKPTENQIKSLEVGRAWNKGIKTPLKERHWNWKGGITEAIIKIRRCFEYKEWREKVFKRDNYTCQMCSARCGGGKKIILNADHYPNTFASVIEKNNIKTYEQSLECFELWDINNGRTLCKECHLIETSNYQKTNWVNQHERNRNIQET